MRTRGRHSAGKHEDFHGGLNLMPLMDIFVVLISMLLLTAVFVQVSIIPMQLPGDSATPVAEKSLDLAVRVRGDHYVITGNGLPAREIARGWQKGAALTVLDPLGEALRDIAGAHPGTQDVQIHAAPDTRYEEIIAIMDVARAAGLPQAALANAADEAL